MLLWAARQGFAVWIDRGLSFPLLPPTQGFALTSQAGGRAGGRAGGQGFGESLPSMGDPRRAPSPPQPSARIKTEIPP